jgi:hypothetical protein
MLHNLDLHTTYTINGAFWTLAIEEQLYLAYFLLLFLRIRFGWTKTLLLCFSARIVWVIMGHVLSASLGIHVERRGSIRNNKTSGMVLQAFSGRFGSGLRDGTGAVPTVRGSQGLDT